MTMQPLTTPRLELVPITLPLVEAVMADRRDEAARLVGAKLPAKWPGRALIERAFSVSIDNVRANPDVRLWGDRLMITRDHDRRLVGSVVAVTRTTPGCSRAQSTMAHVASVPSPRPCEDSSTP